MALLDQYPRHRGTAEPLTLVGAPGVCPEPCALMVYVPAVTVLGVDDPLHV
jgi:hypothetical protein